MHRRKITSARNQFISSWILAFMLDSIEMGEKKKKKFFILCISTEVKTRSRPVISFLPWKQSALNLLLWWKKISNFTCSFLLGKSPSAFSLHHCSTQIRTQQFNTEVGAIWIQKLHTISKSDHITVQCYGVFRAA